MTKDEIKLLAEQAGVRFFGHWIEGHRDALYRFAELLLADGVWYYLWPDGTYCERHERDQMAHMSDDCKLVWVVEHDDEGEPMFPGGLR